MYYRRSLRECFYNKTELKERNWTDSLIRKYLNHVTPQEFTGLYRRQPQKCYLKCIVEKVELKDSFKSDLEKSQIRSARMIGVQETRRAKNIEMLEEHLDSIKVEVIKDSQLIRDTIESKREYYLDTGQFGYGSDLDARFVDNDTLSRWAVNYIRHNLTDYDAYLEDVIFGRTGSQEMYVMLKEDILDKIAAAYPKYKKACNKQKKLLYEDY